MWLGPFNSSAAHCSCTQYDAPAVEVAVHLPFTFSASDSSTIRCWREQQVTNGDALAAALLHTAYNGNIITLDFLVGGLAEGQQGGRQSPLGFLFQ
jgi:hypothetical protein